VTPRLVGLGRPVQLHAQAERDDYPFAGLEFGRELVGSSVVGDRLVLGQPGASVARGGDQQVRHSRRRQLTRAEVGVPSQLGRQNLLAEG
jgi:hypothetical protein